MSHVTKNHKAHVTQWITLLKSHFSKSLKLTTNHTSFSDGPILSCLETRLTISSLGNNIQKTVTNHLCGRRAIWYDVLMLKTVEETINITLFQDSYYFLSHLILLLLQKHHNIHFMQTRFQFSVARGRSAIKAKSHIGPTGRCRSTSWSWAIQLNSKQRSKQSQFKRWCWSWVSPLRMGKRQTTCLNCTLSKLLHFDFTLSNNQLYHDNDKQGVSYKQLN